MPFCISQSISQGPKGTRKNILGKSSTKSAFGVQINRSTWQDGVVFLEGWEGQCNQVGVWRYVRWPNSHMVAGEPQSFRIFLSTSEVMKLHTVIGKKREFTTSCWPPQNWCVRHLQGASVESSQPRNICCHPKWGADGNIACWDDENTWHRCCNRTSPAMQPLQVALGTTRYHVVCFNSCLSRQVSLCQRTEAFRDPKPSDNPVTIAQAGKGFAKDKSSQTFWKGWTMATEGC